MCQEGVFHERWKPKKKKMQNKNAFPYRLPAGEAALDTSATQEPTGTDETEQGHDRVRPQEGLEETSGASGRGVLENLSVCTFLRYVLQDRGENKEPTEKPNLSTDSLVIHTAKKALLKIQKVTRRVRKLLYESSRDFSSCSTGGTKGVKARLTVASNWLSISACGLSISSMTASLLPSSLVVLAEGSASALSEPLVPQETSCQLLKA